MLMPARILGTLLGLLVFCPPPAGACTVFRVKASDGVIVVARSMEFSLDLKYDLIVVPRNKDYASPAPGGGAGLAWKSRYGYVGAAAMGMDYGVSDGMNEEALSVAVLWFEQDMVWQEVAAGEERRALAQAMLPDWLLGNCASVEDVRRELPKLKVFKHADPVLGMAPPVHFIVYDSKGGCVVVEYENGACNIYDNPLGILTNAPRFPWQVAHLRQFAHLSSRRAEPFDIAGMTFPPTGQGSGMIGLPGDLTPPSRFVRLAVLTRFADIPADAPRALNLAQHIINTFDIPFGLATDTGPDKATIVKESTQWVTFRDLANRNLYFKTYDNQSLRKVDLNKLDFNAPGVKRIPMYGPAEIVTDVTGQAR